MPMIPKRLAILAASALLAVSCSPAATTSSAPATPVSQSASTAATETGCPTLPEDPGWYGDNHARLAAMITELGDCSGSGDVAQGAPLALFDWDNTVVKNDIGDAMTYWMLANGKILQPADWAKVSSFITPEAATALTTACGSIAKPNEPMPTHTEAGLSCADEILSIYSDGTTTSGAEAFANYNARRIEPQYAFAAQLLAGYSLEEAQSFAAQAREQNLTAAEGATQIIGSQEVTAWVRYYSQITDLIATMQANGWDVRIVSASAEPVVRAWAEPLGLTGPQVMGVQVVDDDGAMTSTLAPCGGEAESMTYIEGKRCRVNQQVFGIEGEAAWQTAPEDQRPAFGAGDSDTDVSFMTDATALKLAINRNKTELMCHAYDNEDGTWLINPMFIDPKEQREEPYPCSTGGAILPDGSTGPLTDVSGNLIEDQQDTVFG